MSVDIREEGEELLGLLVSIKDDKRNAAIKKNPDIINTRLPQDDLLDI